VLPRYDSMIAHESASESDSDHHDGSIDLGNQRLLELAGELVGKTEATETSEEGAADIYYTLEEPRARAHGDFGVGGLMIDWPDDTTRGTVKISHIDRESVGIQTKVECDDGDVANYFYLSTGKALKLAANLIASIARVREYAVEGGSADA
jgi:hypothetical protein